jgi:polyphosphate kinase
MKLYEASEAGVEIRLIVRGMCSLQPGLKGISENIEAISIVDRYLEHPRLYVFYNAGAPEYYIGSADLMTRNIDYRVEVLCPVREPRPQGAPAGGARHPVARQRQGPNSGQQAAQRHGAAQGQDAAVRSQEAIHSLPGHGQAAAAAALEHDAAAEEAP